MLPTLQHFLVRLFKRLYVLNPDAYTLKSSLNIGYYYLTVCLWIPEASRYWSMGKPSWMSEWNCMWASKLEEVRLWRIFFLSSLQTAADMMELCSGSMLVSKKAHHVWEAWQTVSSKSFYVHFLSFFSYHAQTPQRQFL